MTQWLRRRFVAGFFVTVPLIVSVAALVWIFGIIDGFTAPFYAQVLKRDVPGLGMLTTAVLVLGINAILTPSNKKRNLSLNPWPTYSLYSSEAKT